MIKLNNISYNINNKKIIKNISLEIGTYGTTIFMGKNGAGKTTLLKIIANILRPTSGSVKYSNNNIKCESSFLFQNHIFLDRSVKENLLHSLSCSNDYSFDSSINIIKNSLDQFDLLKYLSANINELSLGEKQCISIIRSLITKPKILFLDEPFNYLDQKYKTFSKDILKKFSKNHKIVLITHSNSDASFFSDDIFTISDGSIL